MSRRDKGSGVPTRLQAVKFGTNLPAVVSACFRSLRVVCSKEITAQKSYFLLIILIKLSLLCDMWERVSGCASQMLPVADCYVRYDYAYTICGIRAALWELEQRIGGTDAASYAASYAASGGIED